MAIGGKYLSDDEYEKLLNKIFKSEIDQSIYKKMLGDANERTYDYGSISNKKIPIKWVKTKEEASTQSHPFRTKVRYITTGPEIEDIVDVFKESDYIETKILILK